MSEPKWNRLAAGFGIGGFIFGGFLGFLCRPCHCLEGQLSFEQVITRGTSLAGMEQMIAPIAQKSFFMMLTGAIIVAIGGSLLGFYVSKIK